MAETAKRHFQEIRAYELFLMANPLFSPDTRLVLKDKHPKFTSDAVARTINCTQKQLANSGVISGFDNKKAHTLIQQLVSDPHSKKADNLGIQSGQTIVFDPFDPRLGLVPNGVQLPFTDFPITISRDDTGYTASLPFVGTEAINPFRAEAYVQLTQLSGSLNGPGFEILGRDFFYNQINQAITALNLQFGPQHSGMYDALNRAFLQQLAEKTGVTLPEIQDKSVSHLDLQHAVDTIGGVNNLPPIVLPFQGSFSNDIRQGIKTYIDVTSNPTTINVEPYLDGVQLVPAWEQITRASTTVTAIGSWRTPINDLVKGKRAVKSLAYGLDALQNEIVNY